MVVKMNTPLVTDRTPRSFLPAFLHSQRHPHRMPDGVNDWDTPLADSGPGSVPVVLLHGTWMNSYCTWALVAPTLVDAGHRVFAVNYGQDPSSFLGRRRACFGNGGLLASQTEVAAFIDRVLSRTGATAVDLVCHSQGVAQARLYLSDSGGAGGPGAGAPPKVRRVVGFAGSNHGTTMCGLGTLGRWARNRGLYGPLRALLGRCAEDQMNGSAAMAHINLHGDTVPGVDYTMLCTRYDEIVTPWRTQFLEPGEGARVRNLRIQDHGNGLDLSDHLAILYSPRALDLMLEALDHGPDGDYRARHPHVTGCVLPLWGRVGGRWDQKTVPTHTRRTPATVETR